MSAGGQQLVAVVKMAAEGAVDLVSSNSSVEASPICSRLAASTVIKPLQPDQHSCRHAFGNTQNSRSATEWYGKHDLEAGHATHKHHLHFFTFMYFLKPLALVFIALLALPFMGKFRYEYC